MVVISLIGLFIGLIVIAVSKNFIFETANGFTTKVDDLNHIQLSVVDNGILKGQNGSLVAIQPQDITKQPLSGFDTEIANGFITDNDTILSALKKLSIPMIISSRTFIFKSLDETLSNIIFNAHENRAIPIPVENVQVEDVFAVDASTGFCQYNGSVNVIASLTYYFTMILESMEFQEECIHFVGFGTNATWQYSDPQPSIVEQNPFVTSLNISQSLQNVSLQISFIVSLSPNQTFALCARRATTTANTYYKHFTGLLKILS